MPERRRLVPAYQELVDQLPNQEQLGIDETPTMEKSPTTWLWTFVAAGFTLFGVRLSRAATIVSDLLTSEFSGTIPCDRAKMSWSLGLDPAPHPLRHRLQWCWAHLKRDFPALIDSSDNQVKRLGHDLLRPTKGLFEVSEPVNLCNPWRRDSGLVLLESLVMNCFGVLFFWRSSVTCSCGRLFPDSEALQCRLDVA